MSDYRLHLGDCLPFLRGLEAGSVDAVITDPPYGKKTHEGARTGGNGHGDPKSGKEKLVKFDSITDEEFYNLCHESVRISKRWVVMTCEWRHAAKAEEMGLPVIRLGVWIKRNGAPQFTGDRPGTGWEAVLVLHREGRKRWNGGGHHAVWDVPKVEGEHPTGKPPELLRQWIQQFTDAGETILDPFMGGGETGVQAIKANRNFIGVEIDPAYYAIAERRIEQASRQQPLFSEAAPVAMTAEQEGLI